jgi:hypothetical protein
MARTVVAAAYGGPEVLSVVDAEVPPPGPGEVTIEVSAAGVNDLRPFEFSVSVPIGTANLRWKQQAGRRRSSRHL